VVTLEREHVYALVLSGIEAHLGARDVPFNRVLKKW
jgi:hypothetical protein